jgi:hypothetical protein
VVPESWHARVHDIAARPPAATAAGAPFCALLNYVLENDWAGGCHAISAVLHVLFREAGLSSTLVVGEAALGRHPFEHSWVELGGEVYDVAIVRTLEEFAGAPPTFRSADIVTLDAPSVRYGVHSGQPRDAAVQMVLATPFLRFMSRFPGHLEGLWGIARIVGKEAGMQLNVRALKASYGGTTWTVRDCGPPSRGVVRS